MRRQSVRRRPARALNQYARARPTPRISCEARPNDDSPRRIYGMTALHQLHPLVVRGIAHLRFFDPASFALARSEASFARNFAMRSISCTGTGWESGKRIVPLSTLYGTRSSLNAATR